MATVLTAKPLEEICFAHILRTLEDYTADHLAQLPKKFRDQALNSLPIVDICQLEGTQFTSGCDMDAFWQQLYKKYIDPHPISSQKGWKESFFTKLCSTILKDDRPYGYFQVVSRNEKRTPWVGSNMSEDLPPRTQHPVDYVNYLVAAECESSQAADKEEDKEEEDEDDAYIRRRYGPAHVTMRRHEVTLVKGKVVPPAKVYHQTCQSKQLIPPRYAKFFPEGSHFLPDYAALELINKKCQFYPKQVFISVPEFSTFLHYAEHEASNLDFLSHFFKELESLTICGEPEENLKWRVIRGAKAVASSSDIPSKLLEVILSNPNPKLDSLSINFSRTNDTLVQSITPMLTSSYSGLKELDLRADGEVSPDLQRLISITNYQPLLHTISISITEIEQIFGSFGPIVKNTPRISVPLLHSWIQICFKKPSLHHLKLCLSPTSSKFLLQVLETYFSTPCSHDQTLTFSINLRDDSPSASKSRSAMKSSLSNMPPPGNTSAPLLHQFDDTYTHHKSLVFNCCSFKPSFTASVYQLQPLRINQFVINDLHYSGTSTSFSQLAQQPGFDMQSFQMTSVGMKGITFDTYNAFLQKKSLKSVKFISCSSIDVAAIRRASALNGFHLEEKPELERGREKFTYTFTKK